MHFLVLLIWPILRWDKMDPRIQIPKHHNVTYNTSIYIQHPIFGVDVCPLKVKPNKNVLFLLNNEFQTETGDWMIYLCHQCLLR